MGATLLNADGKSVKVKRNIAIIKSNQMNKSEREREKEKEREYVRKSIKAKEKKFFDVTLLIDSLIPRTACILSVAT